MPYWSRPEGTVVQRQALLFVDQVDSTRLLGQIGDEAMVNVRRRLHRLMNDAVTGQGGRVFGDMGDGVAAVFDSASDAARAAIDMQDNAETTRLSDEPTIELRVGVHHGDVVPNGEGLIGMTVHVAARLCDSAPNGHIAASEAFCAALGTVDGLQVTPYERRVMKGIAEPMEVRLLTRVGRSQPLPTASAGSSKWEIPSTPWLTERSTPRKMVGRDADLLRLEALGAASDERVQLAFIDGEPGIGKSTLLHHCGAHFAEQGRLCIVGRAVETQHAPYREFIEAIAHVIPHLPDSTIADHVLRHGHLLARLIPGLGHRAPTFDPAMGPVSDEPDRFRLFEAIADLLRSITPHQPMVILLEDLHWSAEPSLALLEHLGRSVHIPSLLVIASFRPVVASGSLANFLGRVGSEGNVTRVRLGPLGVDDVKALVADLPFADVADQLHQKTSGSPLFLTEMIRSFDESGQPARALDGSLLIPGTVQELAITRVDRLGPAHRAVLADAAVLGPVFDLTDVEGLAASHIDVLATLEEAEQAGLVITHPVIDEAYLFGHAVVRDALYDRISAPRRRRRHRAAADVILASGDERVSARATEVLRHIDLSKSDRSPGLIASLARSAAVNAIHRLDLDDAVVQRQRVVASLRRRSPETPGHQVELTDALLALGAAETSAGHNNGRSTFVNAAASARAIERWDLFSEAASGYGGPLKENQAILDVSEPAGLITEALEHEPGRTAMRARLLTALAIWQRQHVPYAARRKLTDEALEIARSLDDKRTLATVLAEVHRGLHGPNATMEALAASEELEELAVELGDDMVALQALNLRLLSEFELGRWVDLAERSEQLDRVAERIGTIEGKRISLLWRGTVAALQGDDETHKLHITSLDNLIVAFPAAVRSIMIGASSMMMPWLRGQSRALLEFVSPLAGPFTRALFAADSDQLDLALQLVAEGGGSEHLETDQNYLFFHDALALTRTAARSGNKALASQLYETLAPLSGRNARMGLVSFLGAVDHHLGSLAVVLDRPDVAITHFTEALERHRSMQARPWIALTAAELARVLRTTGADGHEDLAEEARRIATELGLLLVLETLGELPSE